MIFDLNWCAYRVAYRVTLVYFSHIFYNDPTVCLCFNLPNLLQFGMYLILYYVDCLDYKPTFFSTSLRMKIRPTKYASLNILTF